MRVCCGKLMPLILSWDFQAPKVPPRGTQPVGYPFRVPLWLICASLFLWPLDLAPSQNPREEGGTVGLGGAGRHTALNFALLPTCPLNMLTSFLFLYCKTLGYLMQFIENL